MSDLSTLEKVKSYLGVTGSGEDTLLGELLGAASARIRGHCGREITSATYTEQYDGRGLGRIVLVQRPATSITTVHDALDRAFDSGSLVDSDDYTLYGEEGIVELDPARAGFQDGVRNVQVVYVAGYSTVPADVDLAARILSAHWYNRLKAGADGLSKEALDKYRVQFVSEELPAGWFRANGRWSLRMCRADSFPPAAEANRTRWRSFWVRSSWFTSRGRRTWVRRIRTAAATA